MIFGSNNHFLCCFSAAPSLALCSCGVLLLYPAAEHLGCISKYPAAQRENVCLHSDAEVDLNKSICGAKETATSTHSFHLTSSYPSFPPLFSSCQPRPIISAHPSLCCCLLLTARRHKSHIQHWELRNPSHRQFRPYILCIGAFWSIKESQSPCAFIFTRCVCVFLCAQLRSMLLLIQQIDVHKCHGGSCYVNLRSVFVTAVKDEEGIWFSEEVLLIQLVATKLQHHRLLKRREVTKIYNV